MCMSNKSGPQLYSGSGPAVPNPGNSAGNDGSDDTDGNSFGSLAYHKKIRDDAAARADKTNAAGNGQGLASSDPNKKKSVKKTLFQSMFG